MIRNEMNRKKGNINVNVNIGGNKNEGFLL